MIWALFDTSFGNDTVVLIPGKVLTSGCMIFGVAYNIYLLITILNTVNTIRAAQTKYHETMNQLDAYMQMKQFPIHLQNRLKFFYKKKFRNFYYNEEEIMGSLSEPIQREILINTGQVFVERVELFQGIPKSLLVKIAASCKKEHFLPNDLVSASLDLLPKFIIEKCFQIFKAGSIGDCMYFIASGTVCVTTTNGTELCHLSDGQHFGEIALIFKSGKVIKHFELLSRSE